LCSGQLGIALSGDWKEPLDEFDPADWYASDRAMQFSLGWFANPIFGDGDYPHVLKDTVGDRLPTLNQDDVQGSLQFDSFSKNCFSFKMCVVFFLEKAACKISVILCFFNFL